MRSPEWLRSWAICRRQREAGGPGFQRLCPALECQGMLLISIDEDGSLLLPCPSSPSQQSALQDYPEASQGGTSLRSLWRGLPDLRLPRRLEGAELRHPAARSCFPLGCGKWFSSDFPAPLLGERVGLYLSFKCHKGRGSLFCRMRGIIASSFAVYS